jgi:hypothetical protein
MGIANPVYRTMKRRITDAGASACSRVFVIDAISRKSMLIDMVILNDIK